MTPETSYGFAVNELARGTLRFPLHPFQEWLTIHAGELLPDGRPRFRIVIVLISRQAGKSTVFVVLGLFWQFIEGQPMTLLMSTKLDYAKKLWMQAVKLAERVDRRRDAEAEDFTSVMPRRKSGALDWHRDANGEQESYVSLPTIDEYGDPDTVEAVMKIAASNEDGGRSLTINRLVIDELRQHHNTVAWEAAEPAASPDDAQIWCLSNAGDDNSVVLNELREQALTFIETGEGDPRIGLFEWSAPEGSDPEDVEALAQANPRLGHGGRDLETLLAGARNAKAKGGKVLAAFMTNYMCLSVRADDPAVDVGRWRTCGDPEDAPGNLAGLTNYAACLAVSVDGLHATLAVAGVAADGRVRPEALEAWTGADCLGQVARDLPTWLALVKPRAFGWFPGSPAAALTAELGKRKARADWPPRDCTVDEIRGELPAVCMGFASLVRSGTVVHANDPLVTDHVTGAQKLYVPGGRWVFGRPGAHVDAAYAVAGAVHLARTLPPPKKLGKPRLVVVD